MDLPDNAEVLDAKAFSIDEGWFAGIRFRVPEQGGYDRPPHDDMFRTFKGPSAETDAKAWLTRKLSGRSIVVKSQT